MKIKNQFLHIGEYKKPNPAKNEFPDNSYLESVDAVHKTPVKVELSFPGFQNYCAYSKRVDQGKLTLSWTSSTLIEHGLLIRFLSSFSECYITREEAFAYIHKTVSDIVKAPVFLHFHDDTVRVPFLVDFTIEGMPVT